MTIAKQIVNFISETYYSDFSIVLISKTINAIIDYVGVCIAGSKEQISKNIKKYAIGRSTRDESTLFGTETKLGQKYAALFNGTSAHALDFDDVSWTTIGHPSVTVAPAAFATGEFMKSSGKEIIKA
jgi:2-methylcitrate dehydratase PrpD